MRPGAVVDCDRDPGAVDDEPGGVAVELLWVEFEWVPELPGAVTQGRDMDEASEMIQEAVGLLLQSHRENAVKVAPTGAVWEALSVDVPVS